MTLVKILPTLIISLYICAGIVYASQGVAEWRGAAYCFLAAGLNAVVTW